MRQNTSLYFSHLDELALLETLLGDAGDGQIEEVNLELLGERVIIVGVLVLQGLL